MKEQKGKISEKIKIRVSQGKRQQLTTGRCSGDGQMWMHFAGRFKSLMSVYSHTTLNVPDLILSSHVWVN